MPILGSKDSYYRVEMGIGGKKCCAMPRIGTENWVFEQDFFVYAHFFLFFP